MIAQNISFDLPVPWNGVKFQTLEIGSINFLVGPNGSGKSRFAATLQGQLPNSRLLGTDRLSGMEQQNYFVGRLIGDFLANGLAKNQFSNFKAMGAQGSGIDSIVLLEERLDLRIQVEATLSHLFNRRIALEWDSGNLVARAVLGKTGHSYRLDREECHGIKELLVLLTHLYNTEYPYLIIDEPELNLHPQYQSFFMQEVRRVAGDPKKDKTKKIVFLVTHSSFILDFRSVEDVKSVVSFRLDHSAPMHIFSLDAAATAKLASLVPRLNVHHKQLFFSDNPVFVEGLLDAQFLATLQESRGVSVAGAGSCIIDAGGCEEVNHYLELSRAFGKEAHFLYDLDSLFGGNLRACVRSDGSIQSFLATAGVGNDFGKYCGELDRKLTDVIDRLLGATQVASSLAPLSEYLNRLGPRKDWKKEVLAKARVAIVTAISRYREDMITATCEGDIHEIEGRVKQIVAALRTKNIALLPGGTLERYLPAYAGDPYDLTEDAKRRAVDDEVRNMADLSPAQLAGRYGELYDAASAMPGKVSVDIDQVLRGYLSQYIHDLQKAVVSNPTWELNQIKAHLGAIQRSAAKVFTLTKLERGEHRQFNALIEIATTVGAGRKLVRVDGGTNAGMGDFQIEDA